MCSLNNNTILRALALMSIAGLVKEYNLRKESDDVQLYKEKMESSPGLSDSVTDKIYFCPSP